jgi:hypothetical protein
MKHDKRKGIANLILKKPIYAMDELSQIEEKECSVVQ